MTKKFSILFCTLMLPLLAMAQGVVKGKILDKATDEPMPYVNVVVNTSADGKFLKGAITDEDGAFSVSDIADGNYQLVISYFGYKEVKREFSISSEKNTHNYSTIYLSEDVKQLSEVTVKGQRSSVKLEVDRKSFDVSQDIANAGGAASDVLENIPSVEVDNDGNISLRGNSSVEVWINGKASGLTSDNRAQILQQLPAESIDRIEVIDNPSAKFSAEGSAGIINIVLKKDRKAGYYGSLQTGADTRGGANVSGNINYNSSKIDTYLNIGYRHREGKGGAISNQQTYATQQYQRYNANSRDIGNNLFTRAGITWHATSKDDFTLSGMMMHGKRNDWSSTLYNYGNIADNEDYMQMYRRTKSGGAMHMYHGELGYRHEFSSTHFIDMQVDYNQWKSDNDSYYRDSTTIMADNTKAYSYQYRPMHINNHSWQVKVDYENAFTPKLKLQTGYQGNFSKENTPQESFADNSWNGENATEDQAFYNRFIYNLDIHALYATLTGNFGKFGLMAGLRGEYWRVNTESYTWEQEHDTGKRDTPFKKDYFELFPSVFMSYQLTPSQQLQVNYTRRLRRPWGGELNSFRNTRDALMVEFGNPQLTPEFSNSFSLNYLKTWTEHSLLVSAYYRPTTDVIQRIKWQTADGMMYQTNMNVAESNSSGVEIVLKNKLFRKLDLTTTANAYYYHLDGFTYNVEGQTVTGESDHNFTWNARMQASMMLPYDITVQLTGDYRARQVITQGYRKANYSVDFGARKNFFNKKLTVAINCRDIFNTRKWRNVVETADFFRSSEFFRKGRRVNLTLTWNFGNTKNKRQRNDFEGGDDLQDGSGYSSGMGE